MGKLRNALSYNAVHSVMEFLPKCVTDCPALSTIANLASIMFVGSSPLPGLAHCFT